MTLNDAIANLFETEVPATIEDEWVAVRCVLHDGKKRNAGLNFQSGVFNCFGPCGVKSFKKIAKEQGIEYSEEETSDAIEEMLESISPSKRKKVAVKNQVNHLADFFREKKLNSEVIERWGGELILDTEDKLYGYLKFQIDDNGWCARKIFDKAKGLGNGERFYNKGSRSLLGWQNIKSFETLILCEGLTDFLTLSKLGFENIICSMGSKFSKEQAYLLRGKTIFIIYDRDFAGFIGALSAQATLKEYGINSVIIELPDITRPKTDINSYYVADRKGLVRFIKSEIKKYEQFDTNYIARMKEGAIKQKFWRTGIQGLDDELNGGFTTGVYVFTGQTGIGKSSFVFSQIPDWIDQGARVLLCTYELSKVQCWARLASRLSRRTFVELEENYSERIEQDIHDNYVVPLSNHLRIDSLPTVAQIEASIKKVDIVVIDYIQQMPFPLGVADKNQAVVRNNAEISRLMMKYGKTFVVLSSMSEAGSDVKGSGDVRYTCQALMMVAKLGKDRMSLKIKKNTRGREGKTLFFKSNYPHQTISEIDSPSED